MYYDITQHYNIYNTTNGTIPGFLYKKPQMNIPTVFHMSFGRFKLKVYSFLKKKSYPYRVYNVPYINV